MKLDQNQTTYMHGIVLLKRALITFGLAHEDDDGTGATEESVSRALVGLP